MKSLSRLWAFLLIFSYVSTLALPAVALAATTPFPTCTLSINPSVVGPGGSATIKWTSTNATTGAITNIGNVTPVSAGSKQILPPTTSQITVYIGSFTGPGGTANCTASVQISYGTDAGTGSTGSGSVGTGGTVDAGISNPNPIVTPINGTTINSTSGSGGLQKSIVQCGLGTGDAAVNCEACHLAQLIQNIINFAIGLSIPIAAVLFAWAGILYFTSGANPSNKEHAKKIFGSALLGFLIAITGWLVVNTVLHALLDGGQVFTNGSSWFTVQCSTGNRPVSGDISKVINSVLPGVNTAPPVNVNGGSGVGVQNEGPINNTTGCAQGAYLNDDGFCIDAFGSTYTPNVGSRTSCAAGSTYSAPNEDDPTGTCFNDTTGEATDPIYSASAIANAAASYFGANTSSGPEGGNKACAWAVNNILKSEGIAPIDGNLVYDMEQELRAGRGYSVSTADAQAGDIVVWKTDTVSHVGICYNENCSQVVSNSSANATFTNISGTTFLGVPGRIYRVK